VKHDDICHYERDICVQYVDIICQQYVCIVDSMYARREDRPRDEMLREIGNLGEGGPLCPKQASQHNGF
jgi:hypothetical protein